MFKKVGFWGKFKRINVWMIFSERVEVFNCSILEFMIFIDLVRGGLLISFIL